MILAIDYDGTIADTNAEKVKWIRAHLDRDIPPWHCNRTECVPQIGESAYDNMGDYVYERISTMQALEVSGGLNALRTLDLSNELHLVTARPLSRLELAKEWLDRQGALRLFKGLHSAHETAKADICSDIGAHVLIDDDARHLAKVDLPDLSRILLQSDRGDVPVLAEGMLFFSRWSEVVDHIEDYSP
jgi:hypothetical protein